jgi:ABC-type Fe3+-hydroxamate transport system substrate-binding protein
VSLVPSSTETLLALGADVVACTRFCEQPGVPQVGGTKNPDIDAIVALHPDVVVLDREENRREDHDELTARGVEVFVSDVRTVDDALAVVDDLAELIGLEPERGARGLDAIAPLGCTAFVPIWRRPWMTIGSATYGASVLDRLGVELITGAPESDYPVVDLDEMASRMPALVIVPSEPYDFTGAHLDELRSAFAEARIVLVDGQDLFWWGIRTREAINRLARTLE